MIGPVNATVAGRFGLLRRASSIGGTVGLEVLSARRDAADPGSRPRGPRALRAIGSVDTRATASSSQRCGRTHQAAPGKLNWRATMRRGEPYVNVRHPERSTDLIVLVDTFSAAALPRQVRAATGLAVAYLARHDRVGLVAFGGVLQWVEPAMGRAQVERLVAALTLTEWHHSYAWKSAETIPSRTLPATGLVVAISPLEDPRMLSALAAIRARGVDLAVIETAGHNRTAASGAGRTAARIIELERADMRANFVRRGVPVVAWRDGESLEVPLAALAAWRRRARRPAAR